MLQSLPTSVLHLLPWRLGSSSRPALLGLAKRQKQTLASAAFCAGAAVVEHVRKPARSQQREELPRLLGWQCWVADAVASSMFFFAGLLRFRLLFRVSWFWCAFALLFDGLHNSRCQLVNCFRGPLLPLLAWLCQCRVVLAHASSCCNLLEQHARDFLGGHTKYLRRDCDLLWATRATTQRVTTKRTRSCVLLRVALWCCVCTQPDRLRLGLACCHVLLCYVVC